MIFTEPHRHQILIEGNWLTYTEAIKHVSIRSLDECELLNIKGQHLYIRCLYFYQLVRIAEPFTLTITRKAGKERTFIDETTIDFINDEDISKKQYHIHRHFKPVHDTEVYYCFKLPNNPSQLLRDPIVMVYYHIIPTLVLNTLKTKKPLYRE